MRNGWPGAPGTPVAGPQGSLGEPFPGPGRRARSDSDRSARSRETGAKPAVQRAALVGGADEFLAAMPRLAECCQKARWGAKPSAPERRSRAGRGLTKDNPLGGHSYPACGVVGGGLAVVTSFSWAT